MAKKKSEEVDLLGALNVLEDECDGEADIHRLIIYSDGGGYIERNEDETVLSFSNTKQLARLLKAILDDNGYQIKL